MVKKSNLSMLLYGLAMALTSSCTVDTGFFDGQPCGPDDVCASGYTCMHEPCGQGYLCAVCRKADDMLDAGTDGGDGTSDAGDATSDGMDDSACQQPAPACKTLPDCQDTPAECKDGQWICDTGYESPERSCDFVDNDCDGETDVGLVCILAGNGQSGLRDGQGDSARFSSPHGLLALPEGSFLVADTGNHCIRKATPDGMVTTIAGDGQSGKVDGVGTDARFKGPTGLTLSSDGLVIIADRGNHCIRSLDAQATVSTIAGSGFAGYADGPAPEARFAFPSSVAIDSQGHILVADSGNHCIRLIDSDQVTTFAGKCGFPGLDDGELLQARFNSPTNLLVLDDGRIFVSEESSQRIRMISADGKVSTYAGSGQYGYQDGALLDAKFANPAGLALGPDQLIWLADRSNNRIRTISDSEVSTVMGSGAAGMGDGPPDMVELNGPSSLAFMSDGRLVIADTNNNIIRTWTP